MLTLPSIAAELYSESTHFLLELIQNANDNDYAENVVPELEFEYNNDFLLVHCNEVGFMKKNVDAICQIGNSTKFGANKKGGAIGEKGIGFKSVFKVANTVYVTSNNYSFKFQYDKANPCDLGMVVPSWSDPPPASIVGLVSQVFYIQLLPERKDEVKRDLQLMNATILTFLRKLRRITVTIGSDPRRTLFREDSASPFGQTIVLHQYGQACTYVMFKHIVKYLPAEEKRPGITQSEIQLAFPLTENGTPLIKEQQVFAHLPLREYGFQVSTYHPKNEAYSRPAVSHTSRLPRNRK